METLQRNLRSRRARIARSSVRDCFFAVAFHLPPIVDWHQWASARKTFMVSISYKPVTDSASAERRLLYGFSHIHFRHMMQ